MAAKRAFISFDFDHDEDVRNLLSGQSKNPDSPFNFADWSVKEPMTGNWKEKVRTRIRQTDLMIVICGYNSSNTKKLVQVCDERSVEAHHIEADSQLEKQWFINKKTCRYHRRNQHAGIHYQ